MVKEITIPTRLGPVKVPIMTSKLPPLPTYCRCKACGFMWTAIHFGTVPISSLQCDQCKQQGQTQLLTDWLEEQEANAEKKQPDSPVQLG